MAIERNNPLTINKPWAEDASTVIPNPPVAGTSYRDETVDDTNIGEGQKYDGVADSARYNQLLYITTAIMQDMLQHGVLPWTNTQDYKQGAVVIGSDAVLYRAIVDNGPTEGNAIDPATAGDESIWIAQGTLKPSAVASPLSYNKTTGALSLGVGNGLKTDGDNLAINAGNGLSATSTGLAVNPAESFAGFDSQGQLRGNVQMYTGNIDLLHDDGTAGFYDVDATATGTKPLDGQFFMLVVGSAQLAISGNNVTAVRTWSGSAWTSWNNIAQLGANYLPLTGGTLTGPLHVQRDMSGNGVISVTLNSIGSSYLGLEKNHDSNIYYFIRARVGTPNFEFITSELTDGGCVIYREDFATQGQWYGVITTRTIGSQHVSIADISNGCIVWELQGAYTLPSFGTWRIFYVDTNVSDSHYYVGDYAGGSVLPAGNLNAGIAIRIA